MILCRGDAAAGGKSPGPRETSHPIWTPWLSSAAKTPQPTGKKDATPRRAPFSCPSFSSLPAAHAGVAVAACYFLSAPSSSGEVNDGAWSLALPLSSGGTTAASLQETSNSPPQLLSVYLTWGGNAGCGNIPLSGSALRAQGCQLCHAVFYTHLRPALNIRLQSD